LPDRQAFPTAAADSECRRALEEFFAGQLKSLGYDPSIDRVFLPSVTAARWLNWATNENRGTISAGRMLGQLCTEGKFKRLQQNKCKAYGRGIVWADLSANPGAATWTDIEGRIADRKAVSNGQRNFADS
jgi:hypothetical protein